MYWDHTQQFLEAEGQLIFGGEFVWKNRLWISDLFVSRMWVYLHIYNSYFCIWNLNFPDFNIQTQSRSFYNKGFSVFGKGHRSGLIAMFCHPSSEQFLILYYKSHEFFTGHFEVGRKNKHGDEVRSTSFTKNLWSLS